MARLALSLAFALCACACAAQVPADKLLEAWSTWQKDAGVEASAVVVTGQGRVVRQDALGMDPNEPTPLASLSKTVTGACIAALVQEGQIAVDTPLGTVLGADAGRHAETALSAFLTHTAGLWPDRTQGLFSLGLRGEGPPRHAAYGLPALERAPQSVGKFQYNNENYAVLGLVIERVTGERYGKACGDRVFGKSKLRRSDRWGKAGAFGGWQGTAQDFARFLLHNAGPGGILSDRADAWPSAPLSKGAHYGMGTIWRRTDGGVSHWHAGLLCASRWSGAGAFFARFDADLMVVVTFKGCLGQAKITGLRQALVQAAKP